MENIIIAYDDRHFSNEEVKYWVSVFASVRSLCFYYYYFFPLDKYYIIMTLCYPRIIIRNKTKTHINSEAQCERRQYSHCYPLP